MFRAERRLHDLERDEQLDQHRDEHDDPADGDLLGEGFHAGVCETPVPQRTRWLCWKACLGKRTAPSVVIRALTASRELYWHAVVPHHQRLKVFEFLCSGRDWDENGFTGGGFPGALLPFERDGCSDGDGDPYERDHLERLERVQRADSGFKPVKASSDAQRTAHLVHGVQRPLRWVVRGENTHEACRVMNEPLGYLRAEHRLTSPGRDERFHGEARW